MSMTYVRFYLSWKLVSMSSFTVSDKMHSVGLPPQGCSQGWGGGALGARPF